MKGYRVLAPFTIYVSTVISYIIQIIIIIQPLAVWHGLLGICFLEQCAPELVPDGGMDVDELAIPCRQEVIDHHVHPLAELPEPEVEDPPVLRVPVLLLVVRNHLEKTLQFRIEVGFYVPLNRIIRRGKEHFTVRFFSYIHAGNWAPDLWAIYNSFTYCVSERFVQILVDQLWKSSDDIDKLPFMLVSSFLCLGLIFKAEHQIPHKLTHQIKNLDAYSLPILISDVEENRS